MTLGAAIVASARMEWWQLRRSRALVLLTVLAAVSFLVLVSLFAMTGSYAPMAVIDEDQSAHSKRFVESMRAVPHAFRLRPMAPDQAQAALGTGRLVGAVTIPKGFQERIEAGETVAIEVDVDNVNEDLIFDVQRSLPASIVQFGHDLGLPGLRATMVEHDLLPNDIPFLSYLAVSGVGLAAFIIAAALGATSVARERETGTLRWLRLSPSSLLGILTGKLLACAGVSTLAMTVTTLVVIFGYEVSPVMPVAAACTVLLCVVLFTSIGAWIGTMFRRTLAIMPLIFGLAMPLYIDCGALEPTRFDGDTIWLLAHLSPLYYATGLLEWTFHGVRITPEPMAVHVAVLLGLTAVSLLLAARGLGRSGSRSEVRS